MELDRAKGIITALAEGIDPTTGEVLPDDSVCNKGDVVRALYALLEACNQTKIVTSKDPKESIDYDVQLYAKLKELRTGIATEKKIQPFMVFANLPLMYMAAQKPITIEDFLEIHGVGKHKAEQYGEKFISVIVEHLNQQD